VLVHQISHGVKSPGQGLAVDPVIPGSFNFASPNTLVSRTRSAELQGLVLALIVGARAEGSQLEARLLNFRGNLAAISTSRAGETGKCAQLIKSLSHTHLIKLAAELSQLHSQGAA